METRRRMIFSKLKVRVPSKNHQQDEEEASHNVHIHTTQTNPSNKHSLWKRFCLLIVIIIIFLWMLQRPLGLLNDLLGLIQQEDIISLSPQHSGVSSASTAPPDSNVPPISLGRCTNLQYTNTPNTKHKPIWIASYPGSGSEMVRDLVQALTGGLIGGSIYVKRDWPYKDCLSSQAATCKTHWPLLPIHSPLEDVKAYHSKAILLVRNPIRAFSSRLNHLWEVKAGVTAHTKQAPESYWNKWIQKNWKQQVKTYRQLIQTWSMNASFPYQVELVLAYEDLVRHETDGNSTTTTTVTGVMAAKRLVQMLHQANARVVIGDENIACLWRHVVVDRPKMKRSGHTYTPGYTVLVQTKILEMLQTQLLPELMQQHHHTSSNPSSVHPELIRLLEGYAKYIQENTRIIT